MNLFTVSLHAALQGLLEYAYSTRIFQLILNLLCGVGPVYDHRPNVNSSEDAVAAGGSPKEPVSQEKEQKPAPLAPEGNDVGDSSTQGPKTSSEPTSRLFALLIGINKYKRNPLTGAIKDVNDVECYLHEVLRTPYSQITTLKDEAATCDGIKSQLERLAVDDKIKKGDAILIYFAGHGSRIKAPEEWKTSCPQVELIIPYDADTEAGTNIIVDQQLGCYMSKIAKAKENNITVILDCCHSGSGTRALDTYTCRSVPVKALCIPNENNRAWAGDGPQLQDLSRGNSFEKAVNHSQTSHVLLAACGPKEQAREKDGQGVFTKALLKVLRSHDISLSTYEDLVKQIGPLERQNPRCEGINKTRYMFSGKIPDDRRYLHNVTRNSMGRYVIEGGVALGITRGAQYRLYENRALLEREFLGNMTAGDREVASEDIILDPIPGQPMRTPTDYSGLLALQFFASEQEYLPVYAAIDDAIYPQLRLIEQGGNNPGQPWHIKLVDEKDRETAYIGLSMDKGNEISIEILDEYLCSFGMKHLTNKIKMNPEASDELSKFLEDVAFFMKHLKRQQSCSKIRRGIEIEFFRVELVPPSFNGLTETWKPKIVDGKSVQNLIRNDKIELDILDESKTPFDKITTTDSYGLTIWNNSPRSLYASVFFFSVGEFGITPYYEPPFLVTNNNNWANSDNQHCIPRGANLEIGHGSSEWPPWVYGLSAGDHTDLGFIKVFLSTRPVYFSSFPKKSAFRTTRAAFMAKDKEPKVSPLAWCIITIPVVQRRKHHSIRLPSAMQSL